MMVEVDEEDLRIAIFILSLLQSKHNEDVAVQTLIDKTIKSLTEAMIGKNVEE